MFATPLELKNETLQTQKRGFEVGSIYLLAAQMGEFHGKGCPIHGKSPIDKCDSGRLR